MPKKPDFDLMSKAELEEYGRTIGLELDKRLTKTRLITQLKNHAER